MVVLTLTARHRRISSGWLWFLRRSCAHKGWKWILISSFRRFAALPSFCLDCVYLRVLSTTSQNRSKTWNSGAIIYLFFLDLLLTFTTGVELINCGIPQGSISGPIIFTQYSLPSAQTIHHCMTSLKSSVSQTWGWDAKWVTDYFPLGRQLAEIDA